METAYSIVERMKYEVGWEASRNRANLPTIFMGGMLRKEMGPLCFVDVPLCPCRIALDALQCGKCNRGDVMP